MWRIRFLQCKGSSQREGGKVLWARPIVLVTKPILFGCFLPSLMDHTANVTIPGHIARAGREAHERDG